MKLFYKFFLKFFITPPAGSEFAQASNTSFVAIFIICLIVTFFFYIVIGREWLGDRTAVNYCTQKHWFIAWIFTLSLVFYVTSLIWINHNLSSSGQYIFASVNLLFTLIIFPVFSSLFRKISTHGESTPF